MIPHHLLDKADSELDKINYVVSCHTCGRLFFNSTLLGVKKLLQTEVWAIGKPMKWYADAAVHWLDNRHHDIEVYLLVEGRRQPYFSITLDWVERVKNRVVTEAELKAALDKLQKQVSN